MKLEINKKIILEEALFSYDDLLAKGNSIIQNRVKDGLKAEKENNSNNFSNIEKPIPPSPPANYKEDTFVDNEPIFINDCSIQNC